MTPTITGNVGKLKRHAERLITWSPMINFSEHSHKILIILLFLTYVGSWVGAFLPSYSCHGCSSIDTRSCRNLHCIFSARQLHPGRMTNLCCDRFEPCTTGTGSSLCECCKLHRVFESRQSTRPVQYKMGNNLTNMQQAWSHLDRIYLRLCNETSGIILVKINTLRKNSDMGRS